MKIAIAGKGGTGKTTITTLLTTYLAKSSHVLAIDSDSNENLGFALGFDNQELAKIGKIRHFMDEVYAYTHTDKDWETRRITPKKTANFYNFVNGKKDAFLEKVSTSKGNISISYLGTVDEDKRGIQSMCGSFGLLRVFLNHLVEGENDFVLVDLPAGNELLTRATVINMDEILLVVEPTAKNLSVAQDIIVSLKMLDFEHVYCIVNKSFKESDTQYVGKTLGISEDHIRRIPFSEQILQEDNNNSLSYDTAPNEAKIAILETVELMKNQIRDKDLLYKRAQKIDNRLFPSLHAKLTEEIHN